jgi:hypothetical protein
MQSFGGVVYEALAPARQHDQVLMPPQMQLPPS